MLNAFGGERVALKARAAFDQFKSRQIYVLFAGAALASLVIGAAWLFATFEFSDMYLKATERLVQTDLQTNRALYHLFTQTCALGGAGGLLAVLQILWSLARGEKIWFSPKLTFGERFLLAFLFPFKGVIAGAMSCGILGGVVFLVGGLEALAKAHLVILGVSLLAGYSEQILQKIVTYGREHQV